MIVRKSPQHAKAFYLYMNTALSQGDIAEAAKVTRKTVWNWIRTEHWAAQKRAAYYSSQQEIDHLYEQTMKINEGIYARIDSGCIATKDELERKKVLLALIAGHQKNGAAWRNVAPDHDHSNQHMVDLNALGALERKNLEKRKQAAEEDARKGPGKRFSEEELNEYYIKVANLKFAADSQAAEVDKEGKPLAEDDPQRLKWEARMREGKRPFVEEEQGESGEQKDSSENGAGESGKENGSGEERSGGGRRSEDGRSNDDLPEGWTWMDMPEDE
jgi:predicted DNA-binding protein YlxM (UPF0122 family)